MYVYLFASVSGTFERQFELPHDHPGLVLAIAAGAVLLIVVLLGIFKRKLHGLIDRAKQGGAIVARHASTSCACSCRRSAHGSPSSG